MHITRGKTDSGLELQIVGRLDSHWADHLNTYLADRIREGHDHIAIDLSGVTFLSSSGIAVLMRFHRQLTGINGMLSVIRPSTQVRTVLEITRLDTTLIAEDQVGLRPAGPAEHGRTLERRDVTFHIFEADAPGYATCRALGKPYQPGGQSFTEADNHQLQCPDSLFALGLGAFGDGFHDCRERYGEFLAVSGAAACLPADGTGVPDYVVASGSRPPDVQILHALVCEGAIARLTRFETATGATVPFDQLVESCLELAEGKPAGIIFVAEVSGLVGAAWRQSPAIAGATGDLFTFPEVRRWLSFTSEQAFARSLALVAGVAAPATGSNGLPSAVMAQLRPLTADSAGPLGHFHAAVFAFRPFRKGRLDLKETVTALFESDSLMGLLHLLNDDRHGVTRQSEFTRGVSWVAPIVGV